MKGRGDGHQVKGPVGKGQILDGCLDVLDAAVTWGLGEHCSRRIGAYYSSGYLCQGDGRQARAASHVKRDGHRLSEPEILRDPAYDLWVKVRGLRTYRRVASLSTK